MSTSRLSETVGNRSIDVRYMSADWDLILALLGGTKQLRDEANVWTPRESRESLRAWKARVSKAVLTPFFEDAIDTLTSKPFEYMLSINGTKNSVVEELHDNFDASGTSAHSWAEVAFKEALTWGTYFAYADLPELSTESGKELSMQDELNAAPYIVGIKAVDVLGWKTVRTSKGVELENFRFIERSQTAEDVDEYSDDITEYVKVIKRDGTWERWEQVKSAGSSDSTQYRLIKEGKHRFGKVPIHVLRFGRKIGYAGALPPLRNLAWMNLRYYQSETDQENILHFARVPLLHYAGGDAPSDEDPEQYGQIVIGPNRVVRSRRSDAKLEHVEHNGNAITSGKESLEGHRQTMKAAGDQPLHTNKSSTATGRIIDADADNGSVKTWVRRTEKFMLNLLTDASEWKKKTVSDDLVVDIFDDFSVTSRPDSELSILQNDRARGDIDHATYINELRRRGVLAAEVDSEDVLQKLINEIPTVDGLDDPDIE